MSISSSFIRRNARLGVLTAVFSISFSLASPALFAQSSSSADYADQVTPGSNLSDNLEFRTQYQNQYPSGGGYHQYKGGDSAFSHIAVEAGIGFASPLGNTTDSNSTGYAFLLGGGYNFNKHLGLMAEYRFDDLGIASSVLSQLNSEVTTQYGINGNTHEWSMTLDPVYNLKSHGKWGGYVTGGGGFYRLLTSFNTPVDEGEECSYYYGCYEAFGTATVSHFSHNQGGIDVGGGVTWKPNPDQHGGLFADVRYEWLDSPGNSTQVLPVTFGYRW